MAFMPMPCPAHHALPALPCPLQRGLVGEIIIRFERKGFKLVSFWHWQCGTNTEPACTNA